MLARILGDLHDDNGAVALPGFYDGVEELPEGNRSSSGASSISTPGRFLRDVGLTTPAGERAARRSSSSGRGPTCDVNGIIGGYTGEGVKTVLPAKASAKVSFRLVGKQNPERVIAGVPRFRHVAPAARRQGRIHRSRRQPGHFAAGQESRPCARPAAPSRPNGASRRR